MIGTMDSYNIFQAYENLVCDGGGVKGIAFYGAFKKLDELGLLNKFIRFAGSSAGAIVAAALACRFTLDEIKEILVDTDFNLFKDSNFGFIRDSWRLYYHFGWYKGDYIYEWFGNLLEKKTGNKDITFQEVYDKFGTELVVTGTCVNKAQTIYYNRFDHPEKSIRSAVRISVGIPIFFKAIKEGNHVLVDGGVLNNYPIWIFDDKGKICKHHTFSNTSCKTLGLKLMSQDDAPDEQLFHGEYEINNVMDFTEALINCMLIQIERSHVKKGYWEKTIPINCFRFKATDFNLTEDKKQKLINSGYESTEKYFNTLLG